MTLDEYIKNYGIGHFDEDDRKYFEEINFIVDEGAHFGTCRRPYFRMRGKKVTPVQAFDIISKAEENIVRINRDNPETVSFWGLLCCDVLSGCFDSFIRPDGYLGINDISNCKYPENFDIFSQCAVLLHYFPYLNFVMAFADWEEVPDYAHGLLSGSKQILSFSYHGFEEAINFGVHVYNGTIHHLNEENARKLYKQYNKEYGFLNQDIYCPAYYEIVTISLFSDEYVDELFKEHGLKKVDNSMTIGRFWDIDFVFTYRMLFAERHFGEPAKFKAWHLAQFLYDAVEMGYSYKDAWYLFADSSVGQGLMQGVLPDASASEADTELYGKYDKNFKGHLPDVENLTNILTVLLDVIEEYQLPFRDVFGNQSFMKLFDYFYFGISCEELYNRLIGGDKK